MMTRNAIRHTAISLMKEQMAEQPRRVTKDEASQELFFACFSFLLLLGAALADMVFRL